MMFLIYNTKNNNLADLPSISKTNICHIPASGFCLFYSNLAEPVENFTNEKNAAGTGTTVKKCIYNYT